MFLDDIPGDRLTMMNASHLPGASIYRDWRGNVMLQYRGDTYQWQATAGGLAGLDGFFSKITKFTKKLHKPLRKALKTHDKLRRKVTKPVRKVVKKYAHVIAPIAAFIPVVGWAVAAGLAVVAMKEKRKKAKTAQQAAELDAKIQQAEYDAEEKRLAAQQAGYEAEYEAEMKRALQQRAPETSNALDFGLAPASFTGGGGLPSNSYSGGGGGTPSSSYSGGSGADAPEASAPDDSAPDDSGIFGRLFVPIAIGAAILIMTYRR